MNTYLKWSFNVLLLALYLDWIGETLLYSIPAGLILIHSHRHVVTRIGLICIVLEADSTRSTNSLRLSKNWRGLLDSFTRRVVPIWLRIIWVYCRIAQLVFYDLSSFLLPLLSIHLGFRVSWYVWAWTLSDARTDCCHLVLCTRFGERLSNSWLGVYQLVLYPFVLLLIC